MTVPLSTIFKTDAVLKLELRPLAGLPDLNGAVASESLDPSSALEGGELLITTGLLLREPEFKRYAAAVKASGAAALALTVGPGSPFTRLPDLLKNACSESDLALVTVSERTPHAYLIRCVFDALADARRRPLQASLDLFAELSAVVGRGLGLSGLMDVWISRTGVSAVIVNRLGRVMGGNSELAGEELEKLLSQSGHPPISAVLAGRPVMIKPLGSTRTRGYLVVTDSHKTALDSTAGLVPLLSLELERLWLSDEPERLRRAETFAAVLAAGNEAVARSRLRGAGLTGRLFRVVIFDPDKDEVPAFLGDLAPAFRGGMGRVQAGFVEFIAEQDDPVLEMLETLAPEKPVGIGAIVSPGHLDESRTQALAAVQASRSSGRPVTFRQGIIFDWLVETGDAAAAKLFSDAILSPVERADSDGTLLFTLKVWIDQNCVLQNTCDRLGIHRHTLRSRLRNIESLLSQPLDALETRAEIWLAIRCRPTSEWLKLEGRITLAD
ncbi:helix-turn-helix domain-containing protein [Paenarthrobacter sp. NPDC090520]|uniref:helix-turn-helix domain-containing protein n=1 Tax=Paenarthrobacter sp. NPDC090520 TaxID=3364382 RepID=UPI0038017351